MGQTLKKVRENMRVHTVFVIYKDGKPFNTHGRIAYEREQDAKSTVTALCGGAGKKLSNPEAFEENLKHFTIVPYQAELLRTQQGG